MNRVEALTMQAEIRFRVTNHKMKEAVDMAFDAMREQEQREQKPMTNADRIRAMTDEELAELFHAIADKGESCTAICGNYDRCKRNNAWEPICKNHYLKWLQQPCGGADHA